MNIGTDGILSMSIRQVQMSIVSCINELKGGNSMKYLFITILCLFSFCDDNPIEQESVTFLIKRGSQYIENITINEGLYVVYTGDLEQDYEITTYRGVVLVAHFEAFVSNFLINHLQCDCDNVGYNHDVCDELFTVTGEDWKIAE